LNTLSKFFSSFYHMLSLFIPIGVNLFAKQCPKTQEEYEEMSYVPYVSVVGSLMYAMVCIRP